jgi:hypothetical protein
VQANGQVCALGGADTLGPSSGTTLSGTVVGIATTFDGSGLNFVTNNGSVYAYGDATGSDFGGLSSGTATNSVGMSLPQYGEGYWLVSAAGVIYRFGQTTSFGSESGATLPGPIVGMTPTADSQGLLPRHRHREAVPVRRCDQLRRSQRRQPDRHHQRRRSARPGHRSASTA